MGVILIPQYWSWILTIIGVTGLYLAGSKQKLGWMIGLSAQALWITYAIVTRQYGFILSAFAYGWVYLRNYRNWLRAEKRQRLWGKVVIGHGDVLE